MYELLGNIMVCCMLVPKLISFSGFLWFGFEGTNTQYKNCVFVPSKPNERNPEKLINFGTNLQPTIMLPSNSYIVDSRTAVYNNTPSYWALSGNRDIENVHTR